MINVEIPGYPKIKLVFLLNKNKKEITEFLFGQNIPLMEVVEYVTDKTPNVNGKTTLFKDVELILVRMDYFNHSIRYISILAHEIVHVAYKIIGDCKKEEAIAYMFDYIFEEILKILRPEIDYTNQSRDLDWFKKMTKV